jgi:hypothetical protein
MIRAILAALALAATASPTAAAVDVAVAGDQHACSPASQAAATARLLPGHDLILAAGDLGSWACYASSWGQHATRVAAGNHDHEDGTLDGFAAQLGPNPRHPTYYLLRAGAWRLFVLDSNADRIDPAAQLGWLRRRLDATYTRCTALVMHHPHRTSAVGNGDPYAARLVRLARRGDVDLVVAGHRHGYERLAPVGRGPATFVVGTAGSTRWTPWRPIPDPTSARRIHAPGVLDLDLRWDRYTWRFVGTDGNALDAGEYRCTRPELRTTDAGRTS